MKTKIFTALFALVAMSISVFSQTTRDRLFLQKGHYYIFKSVYQPQKVMTVHDGGTQAVMEQYVEGNPNQIWKVYDADRTEERYTNFVNVATNLAFDDHGRLVQNMDTIKDGTGWEAWFGWDFELSDDRSAIRICHFLERWTWTATYQPEYKGVFLTLNPGEDDYVTPFLYARCVTPGIRDYSAYNAAEGQYFDFVIQEVNYYSTGVHNVWPDNVSIIVNSHSIVMKNVTGMKVNIYTVDGRLIKEIKTANNSETIPVSQGIYLVKVNNGVKKIIVQ
jgi:hypothetical protein